MATVLIAGVGADGPWAAPTTREEREAVAETSRRIMAVRAEFLALGCTPEVASKEAYDEVVFETTGRRPDWQG